MCDGGGWQLRYGCGGERERRLWRGRRGRKSIYGSLAERVSELHARVCRCEFTFHVRVGRGACDNKMLELIDTCARQE
jgi:hypothetical protein